MNNVIHMNYDVVVVGGGIGGMAAALSAARHGANTALIQDRPVVGGNASSEIRMHISGACNNLHRKDARETGIVEEILLENKKRNPTHSYPEFDAVMWEKVKFQKNLTLYLNTHMYDAKAENGKIYSVTARQLTTEKIFEFTGSIFIDCTGDGTLAYLAGAEYMSGREGRDVFGEKFAIEKSDSITMGNSIMFEARDMGEPVPFTPPAWAHHYTDDDLWNHNVEVTSGYWWVEVGGTKMNVISDAEEIRDELLAIIYGIWNHIKNGGDHGAENLALNWVGVVPGKRESRRIRGDYVLKEQDLLEGRIFEDAIAYGGWPIDMHMPERFTSIGKKLEQTEDIGMQLDDIYTIPYGTLYSVNVENLMMGGRLISASHRAHASSRVMGTCAVASQATGLAAAMAVKYNCTPKEIGKHIGELQQLLLRDDCYIPGVLNQDEKDLARAAEIYCPGKENRTAKYAASGYTRRVKGVDYAWESEEAVSMEHPAVLALKWETEKKISQVQFIFDSDLSCDITQSVSDWVKRRQPRSTPGTVVKDFTVKFYQGETLAAEKAVKGNYQRMVRVNMEEAVACDRIEIEVTATNGYPKARIFEVRVYE